MKRYPIIIIIIIIVYLFLVANGFSETSFSTSAIFSKGLYPLSVDFSNRNFRFSYSYEFLKGNFFFANEMIISNLSVLLGDFYIDFGLGLLYGDRKSKYFIKHIYDKNFSKSAVRKFNYYSEDIDFDSVPDTPRGIAICYITEDMSILSSIMTYTEFSNLVFLLAVEYKKSGVLLSLKKIPQVSAYIVVSDILGIPLSGVEFSTTEPLNISSYGLQVFSELFFRNGYCSLKARIVGETYQDESSEKIFSTFHNTSGLIFVGDINQENDWRTMWALEFAKTNLFLEDLFLNFFSSSHMKLLKNTFLGIKILNDSAQSYLNSSAYFYYETGFLSQKLEITKSLSYPTIDNGYLIGSETQLKYLFVMTRFSFIYSDVYRNFFTFYSTYVKDINDNDIDIKLEFSKQRWMILVSLSMMLENVLSEIVGLLSIKENFVDMSFSGIIKVSI